MYLDGLFPILSPELFKNLLKKIMKIKILLIPVIGFSIVGLFVFTQDDGKQIPKTAIASVSAPINSKPADKIKPVKSQGVNDIAAKTQQLPDEILVEHIQTKVDEYNHLKKGDKLSIYIPQEQQDYTGTVEKNYQQFDGLVKVSTGPIDAGKQFSSFTVTKGPELTLIMVATGDSIYQIEIDNKTGAGTVINDKALDFFRKDDDAIVTPSEGMS